jgi:DNA-binding beta-propeller fold protein YncE
VSEQPPSASGEFAPGAIVAGYRLEERIGLGGMASVFRAYDSRLDRSVALKIVSRHQDEAFRQRFIRESRAAAAVEDPHIIPVFEAGESDGVLFIAMRYVGGGDVRSLIERTGPLAPGRVAEIVSQVAAALDSAHARGLVHRDVKPANMLLEGSPAEGRPDHVYLADFGLSKTARELYGLTVSGQFLGTVDYVAPEQIRGQSVDGRVDQYALACSAFEMLCGQPPFRRDEVISVIYAHLSVSPPSVRLHRPELPEAVDQALARALAKRRADRYETCHELAAALHRVLIPDAAAAPSIGGVDGPPVTGSGAASLTGAGPPLAGPQTALAGPQTGLAGPQTALAGPQTALAGDSTALAGDSTASYAEPASASRYPRPWWRSPAPVAGICAAAVIIGGAAAYVASRGHPASRAPAAAGLTAPGCSTATAPGPSLRTDSQTESVAGGHPYSVAVTRDGRFSFVTLGNKIAMSADRGARLAPTFVRSFPAPGAGKGDVISHNGRYLLAADGSGALVVSVAAAEKLAADPVVGMLTSPGGSLAAEVLTTADDGYAVVSLKGGVAVFNLRQSLAQGLGSHGFVGDVQLAGDAAGMASDGTWLYVASLRGQLSVINLRQAETNPAHAKVSSVRAGCDPARVILTDHGAVVWVTARQSDELLAFSARELRRDPRRALIARVEIGEQPIGETLLDGGTILVADSDQSNVPGHTPNLAIVNMARALRHRPALVGYLPTGALPHQFAVEPGGRTVLVTVQNAGDLEAIAAQDLR